MSRTAPIALALLVGCATGVTPETGRPEATPPDEPAITDGIDPVVTITSPAPGSIVEGDTVRISGTVEDESPVTLAIDGESVSVDDDGSFTIDRVVRPGAHRFRLVATDAGGRTGYAFTAVLAGQFAERGALVEDAVLLSATAGAIEEIGRGAGAILSAHSFDAQLVALNPVADGFWGEANLEGEDHGAVDIRIEPLIGGLRAFATIPDLSIAFEIDPVVLGGIGCRLNVDRVEADITIELGVSGGALTARVVSAQLEAIGIGLAVGFIPDELIAQIPAIQDRVEETVKDVVRDELTARLPEIVADAVAGLPREHAMRMLDVDLAMQTPFRAIEISPSGMYVSADLGTRAAAPAAGREATRFLMLPVEQLPHEREVALDVSANALNAVLAETWAGGAFTRRIDRLSGIGSDVLTVAQLAIVSPSLGMRAPADAEVAIEIDAALAPVVTTSSGAARLELVDVRVKVLAKAPGGDVELLRLSVGAGASLTPAAIDGIVQLEASDLVVTADAIDAPAGFPRGDRLDELVFGILREPLEDLLSRADGGGLRLPSLYGFRLDDAVARADGNYVGIAGLVRYGM